MISLTIQSLKSRGDRVWTLQNSHFGPDNSNERTHALHIGSVVSLLCWLKPEAHKT